MHLTPPRPRYPNRGAMLLASLGLLFQAGCIIPSERRSGPPPASRALGAEAGCATCGAEEFGSCLHSPHGVHGAEAELPWPRFHPLPTGPLVGPGDPGWP